MTLEQLGKRSGLKWKNIQRYEAGDRRLKVDELELLATALGVRPDMLLNSYREAEDLQERAIVEIFRQLEPTDRDYLVRLSRGLLPGTAHAAG